MGVAKRKSAKREAERGAKTDVKSALLTGLQRLRAERPTAEQEARAWLDRVEVLLEWIAQHPKFVEIKSEAARLLMEYRGKEDQPKA